MWMGRPLLTSSVANRRRKSCGVNVTPANPGFVAAICSHCRVIV
jgi:hypothetical protein